MIMETTDQPSSNNSSSFVADKVTQLIDQESGGHGELGLKLQRTESYPYKSMMTLHHHRPFEGSGGGVNGSDGPTTLCNCIITDHHHHHQGYSGGGSVARPLQPFGASSTFKSPMGGGTLGFPFTAAQWQDFERQALIYRHMMASIPVPPDLLMAFPRNLSDHNSSTAVSHHSPLGRGSGFNLRFSNNTDPEPGRCRRTDGKKWRCSRDVAPDQKYCERHMHRGRPRSRKHVEVQAEMTNNNSNNNNINCSASSTPLMANISNASALPSAALVKPDLKVPSFASMASSASAYKEHRGSMDWMTKGRTSNQDLHQLIQMKVSSTTNDASDFQQNCQENLNLNTYSDFSDGGRSIDNHQHQSSDQYYMFLNNGLGSLGDQMCSEQRQRPRQFIDAWSSTRDNSNEANKSCISSNGKLNLSNLTLSMSGSNAHQDDSIDQSQMGLGVKSLLPLSWMNPVPSIASPPGGPLGEVLQSSAAVATALSATGRPNSSYPNASSNATTSRSANANVGLNLMTDNWGGSGGGGGGGDASCSPQAPKISSPSGVLQRTLASLSDSSGSSSPTFTAPAKSETALHWVSHSKLPSSS